MRCWLICSSEMDFKISSIINNEDALHQKSMTIIFRCVFVLKVDSLLVHSILIIEMANKKKEKVEASMVHVSR